MAYPKQSAEEIRELQQRIEQLEDLLKRYYGAAQLGDNMTDPTLAEEQEYAQEYVELIHKLMEDTEDLLPELVNPTEPVDDALENPQLDHNDSAVRNSQIW